MGEMVGWAEHASKTQHNEPQNYFFKYASSIKMIHSEHLLHLVYIYIYIYIYIYKYIYIYIYIYRGKKCKTIR